MRVCVCVWLKICTKYKNGKEKEPLLFDPMLMLHSLFILLSYFSAPPPPPPLPFCFVLVWFVLVLDLWVLPLLDWSLHGCV